MFHCLLHELTAKLTIELQRAAKQKSAKFYTERFNNYSSCFLKGRRPAVTEPVSSGSRHLDGWVAYLLGALEWFSELRDSPARTLDIQTRPDQTASKHRLLHRQPQRNARPSLIGKQAESKLCWRPLKSITTLCGKRIAARHWQIKEVSRAEEVVERKQTYLTGRSAEPHRTTPGCGVTHVHCRGAVVDAGQCLHGTTLHTQEAH